MREETPVEDEDTGPEETAELTAQGFREY